MTVQELIDELSKIEDKTTEVRITEYSRFTDEYENIPAIGYETHSKIDGSIDYIIIV